MCKLIWHKPCHGLVKDLRLIVNAFDREKDLAQGLGVHHVQLPFSGETRTVLNELRSDLSVGR